MKKILAVVLTLCMLLSCFAIVASAKRVATKDEQTTTNHYWYFQKDNSWHPVKFNNPSQTYEMDVKLDGESSSLGCYGLSNAPSLTATSVGNTANSVPFTFAAEQWYNVKWVSDGSSTEIFVDGESVGTVAGGLTYYDGNQFYFSAVLLSMDNVKNGGQTFDFEGDYSAWNTESGQGMLKAEDDTTVTYTNDNVYNAPLAGDYVYQFQARADHYYMAWRVGDMGWPTANYVNFEFDVCADSALAEAGDWLGSAFTMSVPNGKIGIGGSQLDFDWTVGQWYHVALVGYTANNASLVYVDGALVGAGVVAGLPLNNYKNGGGYWCGPNNNLSYDNFKFSTSDDLATWTTAWTEDFNDCKLNNDDGGDAGAVYVLKTAEQKSALGENYWYFQTGNSWHPVAFSNPSQTVEMDIMLENEGSNLGCYGLSNAPAIGATWVGLKDNSISVPYTFAAGEWYHVKWVSDGSSTEIFVDGQSVGTVGAGISYYDGNQFYWSPVLVSMDNVSNGGQTFDFEGDYSAWNTESGQGTLMKYDFSFLDKSIPELLGVPATPVAPTGDMYVIGQDGKEAYDGFFTTNGKTNIADCVIDFDLAMAPYTNDVVNPEAETYMDMWLNSGCNIRVYLGTNAVGKTIPGAKDIVAYNWGDATLDNWHNVCLVIKSSYNTLQIYIDTELVYEATMGCNYDMATWLGFIGNAHGTVAIANWAAYDLDLNKLDANLEGLQNNGGAAVYKKVSATGDCASWGTHFIGDLTTTKATKCYEEGTQAVTCAVCGADMGTKTIAKSAHKYTAYNKGAVDADGNAVVRCVNDGCPELYTTANYAEGTYAGNYTYNMDFSDKLAHVIGSETFNNNFKWHKEGYVSFDHAGNYNVFDFNRDNAPSAYDYSMTMDLVYKGTWDDGDTPGHGHRLTWWTASGNGVGVEIGYNAETEEMYIAKRTTAQVWKAAPYTLNVGEMYNLKFAITIDDDEYLATAEIYVNGQLVLSYTEDDNPELYYDFAWNGGIDQGKQLYAIFDDFGVAFDLYNLTFGTSDFVLLTNNYVGDADGDNTVTAADATLVRMILSGNATTCPAPTRADANGDGKITAKDLLIIRKTLAA